MQTAQLNLSVENYQSKALWNKQSQSLCFLELIAEKYTFVVVIAIIIRYFTEETPSSKCKAKVQLSEGIIKGDTKRPPFI